MLLHDVQAFVTGQDQLTALRQLRSAELGKHKVLLASVVRRAAPVVPGDYRRVLSTPYQLLGEIETRAPEVVRDLLSCPQFGAWADTCTRRLSWPANRSAPADIPLPFELGHLSVFAATAAIRSGHAFELDIPLRDGEVTFPSLGTARPGASTPLEWARVSRDDIGVRVRSSVSTVWLPARGAVSDEAVPDEAADAWSAAPRITIGSGGPRLDVVLESSDPYLDRYGIARAELDQESLAAWRRMIGQAWAILTEDHPWLARVVAATVRTLVPLARPGPTRSSSSTDIASFGAVALSLPGDALGMAEVLVHEAHHAILGAITDIMPLVRQNTAFLAYAPWRDDPRPGSALLQGIFAHYGMGRFWGERLGTGPPAWRCRATAEFARLRMMTVRAAETLQRSGVLTDAGLDLLAGIRTQLAAWLDQPVSPCATEYALDVSTDHEVRWRLLHLSPDPSLVAALARAWRGGGPPPLPPAEVAVQLKPAPPPPPSANTRAYLLSLRYQDPGELRRWLTGEGTELSGSSPYGGADPAGRADPADSALVAGRYSAAAAGYIQRITAGEDRDAWAGLAVARRHTGPSASARLFAERPEVVVAVHDHLRGGARVDPDTLAMWLAGP
jgi:HEXXH motif-containing protein